MKVEDVKRVDQVNVRRAIKNPVCYFLDSGAEMNRVNHVDLGPLTGNIPNSLKDLFHRRTLIFPPVHGQ